MEIQTRSGRLIEQYVKLFSEGCLVMVRYVKIEFFWKIPDQDV